MDNTINSLVSKAVGLTNQQVIDYLLANPNISDAQIAKFMQTNGVTPTQMAGIAQKPVGQILARIAATIPNGQTMTFGDIIVQPQYETVGSGQDEQIGALQNVITYKAGENKTGGSYDQYDPAGNLVRTGTQQKVDTSLGGAIKDIVSNPGFQIAALAYGGNALSNALGGTTLGAVAPVASDLTAMSGIPAGTGALTAAEQAALAGTTNAAAGNTALSTIGTTGKTAAELAQLDMSLGGAGGNLGAESLANATATGANTTALTNLTGGSGVFTGAAAGITADSVAQKLAADTAAQKVITDAAAKAAAAKAGSTLIDTTTGLALKAATDVAGNLANQSGITDARNLINQYGTQAQTNLANAYKDAQGLNVGNRTDLTNNYSNASTVLNNLYNNQVGIQQPYQNIGSQGSKDLIANNDYFQHQFNANDLNAQLAPNYAFQLQQGQMANQRAGNMSGGALGGNALKGLQDYTQNYAGGAYQQAFNNYNTQRNNIYNSLAGMANIGGTSAGQLANLGSSLGGTYGNLSSSYGSNLTQGAGQGINAANAYGLNTANLATGIGGALASNATQTGANNATMLNNLGNTALLSSVLKAT